jgi:hypothetical protein
MLYVLYLVQHEGQTVGASIQDLSTSRLYVLQKWQFKDYARSVFANAKSPSDGILRGKGCVLPIKQLKDLLPAEQALYGVSAVVSPSLQLMHGDEVVAEGTQDMSSWKVLNSHLLPLGLDLTAMVSLEQGLANIRAMTYWLSRRVLPLSRENAKLVYNYLGLSQNQSAESKVEVSRRFRGLSILDNYWLKTSGERLLWVEVDPRELPLHEGLALVSLVGESKGFTLDSFRGIKGEEVALDVSLQGSYPKACFRKRGILYVVKGGEAQTVAAEWLCSKLLSCSNVYGYCEYRLDNGKGMSGFPETGIKTVYSRVMSNKSCDIVMADGVPNAENMALTYFPSQVAQMLVFDYLVGNWDRHSQNWGFVRREPTWQITGLHDLYDHNKAFGVSYLRDKGSMPSAFGRGSGFDKTLKDWAEQYCSTACLRFEGADSAWFKALSRSGERYSKEFESRCKSLGIPLTWK